jgi:hypothetical protein
VSTQSVVSIEFVSGVLDHVEHVEMRRPPSRQAAKKLGEAEQPLAQRRASGLPLVSEPRFFLRLGGLAALLLVLASACKAAPSGPALVAHRDASSAASASAFNAPPVAAIDSVADAAPEAAAPDDAAPSWVATAVPAKLRPNDTCLLNCRKRAKELHCSTERCQDACGKLRGAKFCAPQVNAFIACFLKQPTFQWKCEEGLPTLEGDVCDAEQAGVSDCLMTTGGKL